MNTNITIDPKSFEASITFKFEDYKAPKDFKDSLAIISMIAGDYSLDPELELEDFQQLIDQGKEAGKTSISFSVSEEGLEAEFL